MNPLDILKTKTVHMFMKYIKRLNIGYQDDYLPILTNISFIENCYLFDKLTSIYELLMAYE